MKKVKLVLTRIKLFLFYPAYRFSLAWVDFVFKKIDLQVILHGEEYLERKEFLPVFWDRAASFICRYEDKLYGDKFDE